MAFFLKLSNNNIFFNHRTSIYSNREDRLGLGPLLELTFCVFYIFQVSDDNDLSLVVIVVISIVCFLVVITAMIVIICLFLSKKGTFTDRDSYDKPFYWLSLFIWHDELQHVLSWLNFKYVTSVNNQLKSSQPFDVSSNI